MEIFIEKENKTIDYEVSEKIELKEVLKKLNISLDSIILVKNNEVCLEDELVSDSDKIKILSVVSGG